MKGRKGVAGSYLEYGDTEVVFEEGSTGKEIYSIVSGKAEISQRIAEKKEITAILGKGDFFGEMAALNDDVRSMTVTAIGDLCLHKLSLDEMIGYMQSDPEMLRDVCTSLARRLRETNLKVRDLTLRTSKESEEDWMTDNSDKPNILVVDDQPNILGALEALLTDEYSVFTAPDGKNALRIMEQHDIALVVADHRMPEMSGTELLWNVKQMYPDAIRIMLSGYFDQDVLMGAIREVQVHDVIAKPWRSKEVEFTVARWIAQYRKAKRLEQNANRYTVAQKELEAANETIQQLIQELREAKAIERRGTSSRGSRRRKQKS